MLCGQCPDWGPSPSASRNSMCMRAAFTACFGYRTRARPDAGCAFPKWIDAAEGAIRIEPAKTRQSSGRVPNWRSRTLGSAGTCDRWRSRTRSVNDSRSRRSAMRRAATQSPQSRGHLRSFEFTEASRGLTLPSREGLSSKKLSILGRSGCQQGRNPLIRWTISWIIN